jgi:hypothetical protein
LLRWFSPEDETPKKLIIEDEDGANDRYVYAVCERLQPLVIGGKSSNDAFAITLVIHSDVRWRIDGSSQSWDITASEQTHNFPNTGSDVAYPTIQITPTSAKTGGHGYGYKRWLPVKWRVETATSNYPTLIVAETGFDTAALTPAKMQADGDDLRIWVDGIEEENRWLADMDTNHTNVWINLDWAANISLTLDGAIGAGALTTLTLNENIEGLPASSTFMIDSEAFVYTGKNNASRQVTGVTRAAKGTSAAAHADDASVCWIQHDIWMVYGSSTAAAPDADDDYKPAFGLSASANGSWAYTEFGEDDGLRSASWIPEIIGGTGAATYTGNQGANANPWIEIGVKATGSFHGPKAQQKLYNPCGITNANFTNGEAKMGTTADYWFARIRSSANNTSWVTEYTHPGCASQDTWEGWSRNEAITAGSKWVALYQHVNLISGVSDSWIEASNVVATISPTYRPSIIVGAEQTNYSLSCVIENTTIGQSITLTFQMELDETLEVNTDAKTITYSNDNSCQMQALGLDGGARRVWLFLQDVRAGGTNTIKYTEAGVAGVTMDISFSRRYY